MAELERTMKQMTVRISDDKHQQLTALATVEGVSVQKLLEQLIDSAIERTKTDEFQTAAREHLAAQARALGLADPGPG